MRERKGWGGWGRGSDDLCLWCEESDWHVLCEVSLSPVNPRATHLNERWKGSTTSPTYLPRNLSKPFNRHFIFLVVSKHVCSFASKPCQQKNGRPTRGAYFEDLKPWLDQESGGGDEDGSERIIAQRVAEAREAAATVGSSPSPTTAAADNAAGQTSPRDGGDDSPLTSPANHSNDATESETSARASSFIPGVGGGAHAAPRSPGSVGSRGAAVAGAGFGGVGGVWCAFQQHQGGGWDSLPVAREATQCKKRFHFRFIFPGGQVIYPPPPPATT